MSTASKPLQSICHCGAITVTLSRPPEYVNECQCTICRRYAAAWGYYQSNELQIEQKGAGTKKYVWGDGDNEFHFCDHCGCVSGSTNCGWMSDQADGMMVRWCIGGLSPLRQMALTVLA